MATSSITPDVAGLRVLSHPVRLKILGILRHSGHATATTIAQQLGLNTGAASYHLRQLAQAGFITEDTERGNARERWWRAAHNATRTDFREQGIPDEDAEAYMTTVAMLYADELRAAVAERPFLPEAWRNVGGLNDWSLNLTPAQAKALVEALVAVVEQTSESAEDDADATHFVINLNAFVRPGAVGGIS